MSADMVNDNDPLINKFISVPRDMGDLNCGAMVAGIIKGVLDGAGFVTPHPKHPMPNTSQVR